MRLARRFQVLVLALIAAGLAAALLAVGAVADIVGGHSDETIATSYGPLQTSVTVHGAFVNQSDQDYLKVVVSHAQTLDFTLQNTTPNSTCNKDDPYQQGCPVYATLMDSTGQNQVGGSSSSAGTIATADDTETFSYPVTAGTYYVLMESNGDLPNGEPTYKFTMGPILPAPKATDLHLLHAHRSKRATVGFDLSASAAKARVVVHTGSTLTGGRQVMSRSLPALAAGSHSVSFRLPLWLRAKLAARHHLRLTLGVKTWSVSDRHATFVKQVTLRR